MSRDLFAHGVPGSRRSAGFTLIEVMVALVIFGVLSVTVLLRLGDNVRAEQYLESKTLAFALAENMLAELRVAEEWSALRDKTDDIEFAGRRWHVKLAVSDTDDEDLRRVDVQVGQDEGSRTENYIVTLTTYIGRH